MIKHCPACNKFRKVRQIIVQIIIAREKHLGLFILQVYGYDTLGEKVVELLHDQTYLQTIPDIYKLHTFKDQLEELPGFGKKKVEKLLNAIEASKMQTLDRLIFGVKNGVGKLQKLLNHYPSIRYEAK